MRRSSGLLTVLLPSLGILAGCGGASGVPGGADTSFGLDGVTTRVAGTVQPPVTSSGGGTVVTGVAGGNFSSIRTSSAGADFENSLLLVAGNNRYSLVNSDGTGWTEIPPEPMGYNPVLSADGSKVFFLKTSDIWSMNTDGTGETRLTYTGQSTRIAGLSPDGSKILFESFAQGNSDVYTVGVDGSNPTQLTSDHTADRPLGWSPDGTKIYFTTARGPYSGWSLFVMGANGSNQQFLTTAPESKDPNWLYYPGRLSPLGDGWAIFKNNGPNGTNVFALQPMFNTGVRQIFSTSSSNRQLEGGVWSPDGKYMAYHESVHAGDYIVESKPYLYSMASGVRTPFLPGAPTVDCKIVDWVAGPSLNRNLIGTGGALGTNASGFLYGRRGKRQTSFLTFECANRNSARVTSQTGQSSTDADLVFTLAGDSITKISYQNFGAAGSRTRNPVSSFTAPATNALVDIDAESGQVVTVLPYTSNRGVSGAPAVSMENGKRVFRGNFTAVYGPDGKNLAGDGAREVRVDVETDTVTVIR